MATIRHHAGRWIGRYRLYFIIGFIILVVQIYLAYKSLMIQPYSDSNIISQEHQRTKLLEDKNKNHDALVDDEDIQSNSNSIHGLSKPRYEVIKNNNPIINKTILRLDDLDFTPTCEIQSREAISAIHRAKTQKCKRQIANITCLIQENRFYPLSLPNYCPNEGLESNRALGCFRDEKNYRLLSGYYANYKTTNSPKYCSQMCLQSGFPYSGVQYSTECFCGITPPPSTMKQPDSSCNMKCPGEPKEICGGYFKMNIYETGIAKFSAQTAKTSPNENEPNVRIAYLLTLNGRAVRQVQRLIKALFHVDHYFFIHVDSRQDYLFRQLLPLEKRFPNIRLSRNRFSTIWGGASLLQMLLVSMSELLKSDWKWDFIINLSESDFPIKTNEKLIQFLTANKNMNFVKSHGREVQRFIQKQGLDKTFIECDTHMWRTGDRTLPSGIQIDGGSDWITLTREFVAYVTQNNDELIEGLLKVFKHTLLPAESFFHTVLRNSRFCKTYIDNNLHVTNWKRRLGCKCQYKHVVDWCGCSPNDFKIDDWPRLQATEARQLFFARKFEPVVDQRIILKLEEWLFNADVHSMNAQSYWQSVYHYADINPSTDDALISISKSLARMNSDKFSDCKVNVGKILEVTSHHVEDKYKGHIIQYELDIKSHGRVRMEILVNVKDYTDIDKNSHLNNYLLNVFVSSDYDQKEQISRNFGRFIGPYSDIVVIYKYIPDADAFGNKNVTLIFIDPSGTLADIFEAHIDIGRTIHFVKVPLKEPHLPGIWTIKLIHNKQYVGTTKFLITPLETYFGEEISEHHLDFIHVGSNHFYKSTVPLADLTAFFPSKLEKEALYKLAVKNSRKIQADLQMWIDSLVSTFYGILGQCIIISKNDNFKDLKCSNLNIASCDSTTWSTLIPDPKSVIGKIDLSTGMFERT